MTNKKVDLFKASKAMSERVSDYMNKKVWGIVLKTRYQLKLAKAEKRQEFWTFENNRSKEETGENKYAQEIENIKAEIIELQAKYEDQRQKEATFAYIDADKTFYKIYEKAEDKEGVLKAIRQWFAPYKLVDIEGSTLEESIYDAITGDRRASARTIINSGATKFTQKRSKNDVLGLFYGRLSELMLEAGTLKPSEIPEDVRDQFAPKKKAKKSK